MNSAERLALEEVLGKEVAAAFCDYARRVRLSELGARHEPPFTIAWGAKHVAVAGLLDRVRAPTFDPRVSKEDAWIGFVPSIQETIPLRGFAGFSALLAQGLVDAVAQPDHVYRAAGLARIEVYDNLVNVQRMRIGVGYAARAEAEVLARYEPPHVEGRALVFIAGHFIALTDPRQTVFRIVVDADTCNVTTERIGLGPLPGHREYPFAVSARMRPGRLGGRTWADDDGTLRLPAPLTPTTSSMAAWYRMQAGFELSSVASFCRATLELLAVGAPLALVRRVQEAALDEVEHTRVCLSIATAIDGDDVSLGPVPPLPPRSTSLDLFARHTLEEAAVPETVAAAIVHASVDAVVDAGLQATLLGLAHDEDRHADLAWDMLAWAVDAGATLPPLPPMPGDDCDDDDVDEAAAGRPTRATRLRVLAEQWPIIQARHHALSRPASRAAAPG